MDPGTGAAATSRADMPLRELPAGEGRRRGSRGDWVWGGGSWMWGGGGEAGCVGPRPHHCHPLAYASPRLTTSVTPPLVGKITVPHSFTDGSPVPPIPGYAFTLIIHVTPPLSPTHPPPPPCPNILATPPPSGVFTEFQLPAMALAAHCLLRLVVEQAGLPAQAAAAAAAAAGGLGWQRALFLSYRVRQRAGGGGGGGGGGYDSGLPEEYDMRVW